MSAASKNAPKYRRHSVRNLGFVEYDKKRIYFPGAYNSEESLQAYAKFVSDLGFMVYRGGGKPESGVTTTLLIFKFRQWAKSAFPPGRESRATNIRSFTKLFQNFVGIDLAVNFTPLKLKAFQQWLTVQKGKHGRTLSRRYINDTVSAIRQMYKWGVSEELIPVQTYQALLTVPWLKLGRTAARESVPRKPVDWKHVQATLKHLTKPVSDMVRLHWLTGVRSQSLCTAKAGQFDCTKTPWEWRPKHKTEFLGHSLVIFVGPQAQKILKPYLKDKGPDDYLFRPRNKAGKHERRHRPRYDSGSYRTAVQRAAKLAKVPQWTPHQIRHSRGTEVREQFGIEAAQAFLGHAKLDATQIYAQKQMAMARKIAADTG